MSDSGTTNHTAKVAQIREVAMTVREPKNAGEIADAAGVARNTAEKYLTQLVEADKLATIQRGRETCYYPDPVTQYFDQIRDLINDHTKDELTAELEAIRDDIDEWKEAYDVESADELRATVGDDGCRSQTKSDASSPSRGDARSRDLFWSGCGCWRRNARIRMASPFRAR